MNATDFYAVVYEGNELCIGCLPNGVTADSEGVIPIFASSDEMDRYPVCDRCGTEHDYVTLTTDGRRDRYYRDAATQTGMYDHDDEN